MPAILFRSDLGTTPVDRFRVGYGRKNMADGLGAWRRHLEKEAQKVPHFVDHEKPTVRSNRCMMDSCAADATWRSALDPRQFGFFVPGHFIPFALGK